ncbi:MAG TPA: creatininase family protein, partial [Rubricoccaceae bacterium]|nr:creatininase family protein [Rubricoccaceae bacterium]
GVHAPTGLDGMQAEGQCVALAEALGGVVLPPIYAGTDTIKPFKGFGHTVEHRAETVAALCAELLDGLADEGWRVLVVVTGHAGQGHQDALHGAVNAFAARRPDVAARLWTSFDLIQDVYPANHAARGEVSLQLRFAPEHVDLAAIPDGPAPTLDEHGVWGEDPRHASVEEGEAMLRLFVERAVAELRPLLNATSPPPSLTVSS